MKTLRVGLFGAILVLMSACASLGIPTPHTFTEKVDYADSGLTAVVNATATSLDAHQMTSGEAKSVREIALQARSLLNAARSAAGTPAGDQNLSLALSVLQQLQTYFNERSKSP